MADIDPSSFKVKAQLAYFHLRAGNSAQAAEGWIAIARELHGKGHPVEAAKVLEQALRLDPDNRELREELGKLRGAQDG